MHLLGNIGDDPKVSNLEGGKRVAIIGKLRTRNYTEPKVGNERYVTEVVADEILLLCSDSDN